jgi:protease I
MKKIAVLIEDHYQVLEAWYPYLRLREEGIQTIFVGTGNDGYISKEGYPAPQELSIAKAKPGEFDGVVIPGGYAPDILRRHKSVNMFVSKIFQSNKLVAAICHAGWVLVSADILHGKKATCFFAIKDDLVTDQRRSCECWCSIHR